MPNPAPNPTPSPRRRLLYAVSAAGLVVFAAWAVGQAFRDRTWVTGLLFYLPTPLLLAALLVLGAAALRARLRKLGALLLLLASVHAVFVAAVENSFAPRPEADPSSGVVRVVHWNVCWGVTGWPDARRLLLDLDADGYVLSEPPREFSADDFPGYDTVRLSGPVAVAVRGRLAEVRTLRDSRVAKVHAVTWRSERGELLLFVADFPSSLRVHRHPQLTDLNALVAEHGPDLVLGDFNAPRRSAALSALPPGYAHAYDAAGSGWSYTWPVPAPVYSIDQCVFGPRVLPVRHDLVTSRLSDHRLQQFTFRLCP